MTTPKRKRKPRSLTPEQAEQKALIERLWAQGKTAAEVCEAAGIDAKAPNAIIGAYRRRGYDLPHRQDMSRVKSSRSKRWPKARRSLAVGSAEGES